MKPLTTAFTQPANESPARTRYAMPFVRLELVVMTLAGDTLKVLRARRAGEPFKGRWALPGGVLRIDQDADLEAACQRTARERLGTTLEGAAQLRTVGGPGRDERAPWTLSVIYRCMTRLEQVDLLAGKRIEELGWETVDAASADRRMAFDHAHLIGMAGQALREEVAALRFPAGLLAQLFTLTELQQASEAVLGKPIDKSSFRRRLDAAGVVQVVPGQWRTGAFRPAQLYRLCDPAPDHRSV